jgi:Uma2 family endonuclease
MQASQRNTEYISPEEYLAAERKGSERHEYYQGECFAIAGASRWHNLLAGRIFSGLFQHLDGKDCVPYMTDMRLDLDIQQSYVYPDIMAVCGEDAYIADDMVNDADVIVEVLSPGTEAPDRGAKFLQYQSLPSLREYILVSQKSVQMECYRRKTDGRWEYERLTTLSESLALDTVHFRIGLEELYRGIPFK